MTEKKNIFKTYYQEHYALDLDTQNDLAQKNFIKFKKTITLVLIFAIGNLIAYPLHFLHDIASIATRLWYFGGYALISIIMLIYCRIVKNCDRNKNRILKNLPFYLTAIATYGLALYNFFILKTRINGILLYEMNCMISLLFFDFDPFLFQIVPFIPYLLMQPVLIREYSLSTVADLFLLTYLLFVCSFRKRRLLRQNADLLHKQRETIKIITFGNFTILFNKEVVKFQRKKSLELLAYLIYKHGTSVDSKELMAALWGDSATSETYGSNLRNLIVDVKQTLKKLDIKEFFIAEYNSFRINPAVVDCDYYNFLDGDAKARQNFTGEFMSQFSWAEDVTAYLENQSVK